MFIEQRLKPITRHCDSSFRLPYQYNTMMVQNNLCHLEDSEDINVKFQMGYEDFGEKLYCKP